MATLLVQPIKEELLLNYDVSICRCSVLWVVWRQAIARGERQEKGPFVSRPHKPQGTCVKSDKVECY